MISDYPLHEKIASLGCFVWWGGLMLLAALPIAIGVMVVEAIKSVRQWRKYT